MAPARNKVLIFLAKLAVSSGALALIFRKAEPGHVLPLLRSVGLPVFGLAVLLYIVMQMLSTARWRMLMQERFPFGKLFALYMIGSFFSSFLPGLVGGDAVRAYYLNKDARDLSATLGAVFLDRYIGFVSLMLIGMLAFPFSLPSFGDSPYRWLMPAVFLAFALGSVLFFWLRIGRRFGVIARFYEYFGFISGRKGTIAAALLISGGIQLLNFLSVLVIALRMGADVSLLELSVFLPLVIAISSMPISISGIGVREGSFVILLGMIGVSPEVATSLSLAWFLSVLMGGLPGLGFYILHGRQRKELHDNA